MEPGWEPYVEVQLPVVVEEVPPLVVALEVFVELRSVADRLISY